MTHCTATGSITLDGQPTATVCDRTPHDAVLGDWDSNTKHRPGGPPA